MKFYFTTLAALGFAATALQAQTTAFTYQGELNVGANAATGVYDFRFRIFNASSGVVAGPLTNAPVGVTNGLFTTTLDLGAGVFDGNLRTLEIGVRDFGGTNDYTVLSPRQPLTAVPYAVRSLNASNAVNLTAPLQATNMTGTIPNSLLSTNVAILTNNVVFSGSVTAATFTGSGSGLTSLPAASLTGTIDDARFTTNVALQSNPNLNFAGNVAATNFSGGGHGLTNVPGAFFWVVATNNTSAQPNVGYICTNDVAPVKITLPAFPVVRDVYKVAAVGGGGWILAQNASQKIVSGSLSHSIGQNWKSSASPLNWSAIASSADGTKLVATVNNGFIYTSTDSGSTWLLHNSSPINSALRWSAAASSSDGTKLVATVGYTPYFTSASGNIYTSAESGASWASRAASLAWSGVACSADGTKQVAVIYNGLIYTSTNSGVNWGSQSGSGTRFWTAVASSANGARLAAAVSGGNIYTSTNYGTNWAAQTGSGSQTWSALASSADGANLVAATSGGQVYTSSDYGTNWVAQTVSSTAGASWSSVASSSDGSHLAAVYSATAAGYIFTSDDFGATWSQRLGAPNANWSAIASSADGSQLAATVYGGYIYVSSQSSTTTGTAGYLIGPQNSAIELIYVGNNLFLPLSHEGTIRAY